MSSETSTKHHPSTTNAKAGVQSLQPWQFFVLAALGCATAVTFMARGQGMMAVVLLGALMAAAALVGLAALRAVLPLVSPQEERAAVGQRTRAALEREKLLALRAIKELEFDRAMGKLSDEDWKEMSGRLRARAGRMMRQLDAGAGYRATIEQELAKRLASRSRESSNACAACHTINEADAKFCKNCGTALGHGAALRHNENDVHNEHQG
jgi:hypothetical protein